MRFAPELCIAATGTARRQPQATRRLAEIARYFLAPERSLHERLREPQIHRVLVGLNSCAARLGNRPLNLRVRAASLESGPARASLAQREPLRPPLFRRSPPRFRVRCSEGTGSPQRLRTLRPAETAPSAERGPVCGFVRALILCELDNLDERSRDSQRYVGLSRARNH